MCFRFSTSIAVAFDQADSLTLVSTPSPCCMERGRG